MIKLKDILLENQAPNLLIPRRVEGRIEKLIQTYIKNGSKGDLYLTNMNLTKLPDVLKYVDVSGDFACDHNQLTSLENAPKSVSGNFYLHNNKLTSLEGAPRSVGGNFHCDDNKLTSLVGAPESVGGDFYCYNNKLTSLIGAPKSVGGFFRCYNNKLTSLVGAPSSVGGVFRCYNNAVKFTEEQVRAICNVKGMVYV
jgi:hypothetical protein